MPPDLPSGRTNVWYYISPPPPPIKKILYAALTSTVYRVVQLVLFLDLYREAFHEKCLCHPCSLALGLAVSVLLKHSTKYEVHV